MQAHVKEIENYLENTEGRPQALQKLKELPPIWIENILIVDDEELITDLVKAILYKSGSIDVAHNGQEALMMMGEKYYKLILTDIDMPRMDGIELVCEIKQDLHLKSIPVMIVSYKDRQEDRQRGLDAGADYYLTKGSFQDETLIEAVFDLIGEVTE